jgi:FixJ family two-component response regulator
VLDVRLPGKSGIELTRELSAGGSRIPVIFITAHDEPSVHEAVARCGAAALLIKPFAGRKLLDTLESTLHGPAPVE